MIRVGLLLFAGCVALLPVRPALSAPLPSEEPPSAATPKDDASVTILTAPAKTGPPPLMVSLQAETTGLTPPLRFHWSFGNGEESEGAEARPQMYEAGRYDVILTVTDAHGRVKKASVTIEAQYPGCGGRL